tara:strand:+ start:212 stop:433 length:222 start_codon:yes stop_codon:yes gene_type:complete
MKRLNKFLSSGWNIFWLLVTANSTFNFIKIINNSNDFSGIFSRSDFYFRGLVMVFGTIYLFSKFFPEEEDKEE